MSEKRPLYIGNIEGILGIEVLNAKKCFWIKSGLLPKASSILKFQKVYGEEKKKKRWKIWPA